MTVTVTNLNFYAIIGLLEHERIAEQRVVVDCHIEYNYNEGHYIDYAELVLLIENTVKVEQFELLEEALLHLEQIIQHQFPTIEVLDLHITKPDILHNATVSVGHKAFFKGS